jgi:hypothetical protein
VISAKCVANEFGFDLGWGLLVLDFFPPVIQDFSESEIHPVILACAFLDHMGNWRLALRERSSHCQLTIQRLSGKQNWPFTTFFHEFGGPKVDAASEGCNSGTRDQRECAELSWGGKE